MIDPFYYAVGDAQDPATLESAAFWRKASWEAMDQLAAYSDILGMNFYLESQVECYRMAGTNGRQVGACCRSKILVGCR